uniref:MD-2-related lipid-recognition domain-containing protein n=1 Tax=Romanomermis culicivorax TaxID=13658 RepID=A0A915IRW1_ROMCU
MPFPLPNPDGCRDSGLECPLVAESDNSYNQSLEIKSIYPSFILKKIDLQVLVIHNSSPKILRNVRPPAARKLPDPRDLRAPLHLSVVIEWELVDENSKDIICAKFKAHITA